MSTSRTCCCTHGPSCGCCAGVEPITPESLANRPGLPALRYRVGTHPTFLETMLARLTLHRFTPDGPATPAPAPGPVPAAGTGDAAAPAAVQTPAAAPATAPAPASEPTPPAHVPAGPLAALSTRDPSDPSIALLDAWASVADVLTFYQERIANEGFLRTATERRSVLELARLVGYRPRPGVAASTYLAYTINDNIKTPVTIGKGARVQSVPAPGDLPQTFETSEPIEARAGWSRLKPRLTEPPTWESIALRGALYVKGTTTNLKPNDPLLIDPDGAGEPDLFRIVAVEPDADNDRTRLRFRSWDDSAVVAEGFAELVVRLRELVATAPAGDLGDSVAPMLTKLADNVLSGRSARVLRRAAGDLKRRLDTRIAGDPTLASPATRPWVDAMDAALDSVLPQALRAPSTGFGVRLASLAAPPSQPLRNSLQLPVTLSQSFKRTSDAAYQALSAARPDLDGKLAAALKGFANPAAPTTLAIYALRQKTGLFGQNVPKRQAIVRRPGTDLETETRVIGEWPIVFERSAAAGGHLAIEHTEREDTVYLDGSYDQVVRGSWLVLDFGGIPQPPAGVKPMVTPLFPAHDRDQELPASRYLIARIDDVTAKISRSEYGSSGPATRLAIADKWLAFRDFAISDNDPTHDQRTIDSDFQIIRSTVAYAQTELLTLVESPIEDSLCDGATTDHMLELDSVQTGLQPGRFLIVSGERSDIADTTGVPATEPVMIAEVVHDVRSAARRAPMTADARPQGGLAGDRIHTFVRIDRPLAYCYRRASVTIYANVVKATHGETTVEALGNGDGSKAAQTFALKQRPLTYVAARTPSGAASTLDVFVDDVRWHEPESMVDAGPTAHSFVTATDDNAQTAVTFGNGRDGARLPSGAGNVKAVYRFGIGKPGNVLAGQLTLLSGAPLGVREVVNPIRASGGADAETRDEARANVPVGVKALDRLVSIRDYQDFARAFTGIGKAVATELGLGRGRVVHVTIAGADDIPIDPESDLFGDLRQALTDFGDPYQPVMLATRHLLLLVVSAGIRILPDYQWEPVVTAVRSALLDTFGFAKRELGENVQASEALGVMQAVTGVDYVDLDVFGAVATTAYDADGNARLVTPDEIAQAIVDLATAAGSGGAVSEVDVALAQYGSADTVLPAQLALLSSLVPATLVLNQIKDVEP